MHVKSRLSFDSRLFYSIALFLLAIMSAMIFFQYRRESYFRQELLHQPLSVVNRAVLREVGLNGVDPQRIDSLLEKQESAAVRLTLLLKDGTVLYDNRVLQEQSMDNHLRRPEIVESLRKGEGRAIRFSHTLDGNFFYVASSSDLYVVRSALPYDTQLIQQLSADWNSIYLLIAIFLAALLTLYYFTRRLSAGITLLRNFTNAASQGQAPDQPIEFPNNDVGEIFSDVVTLSRRLMATSSDLSIEKEKLLKHLQITQEGLAIFSAKKEEIVANSLFIQYVGVLADFAVTRSDQAFLLPEFQEINRFIFQVQTRRSLPETHSFEQTIQKDGRTFTVRCVVFEDNTYEIMLNNTTEREEQIQLKRQLTQNISHELKTPVSSVQGYIETLLASSDIDQEQQRFFLERALQQCQRLTGLLRDISALNRMDEATYLIETREENLMDIIKLVRLDVAPDTSERGIHIVADYPDSMPLEGNYSLLYSVFRNLFDNTIAYAGSGSTIYISMYHEDSDFYYFSYADDGVGVDSRHIENLFDRFYRVDKGRSRKLGGTGLGLAIVKNAILFHKGEIVAKPRQGGGLEFLFSIRKSRI